MKILADRLLKSARLFVQTALAAYDRQEPHVFLLHAGTSLEHMLKARLAELNPALIAKKDSIPSLAWFADESRHTVQPTVEMRTITLDDALLLATAINVPLAPYKENLGVLQRHRNGVAHLGIADEKIAYDVLPAFLQTMILLAAELNVDPSEIFGTYNDFVVSQLDEYRAEQERVYQGRIAQARMRLQTEHGELLADARAKLGELVELRWHRTHVGEQLVTCPVCSLPGYAEGHLDIKDWEADYDKEGNPESAYPVLEYQVFVFRCPTCGLLLDTPELIRLANLLSGWELPDEDYDAYMRELAEESWDYYEDR